MAPAVAEQVEIRTKYEGYIARQGEQVKNSAKLESVSIPADIDYLGVRSLSHEGREKLTAIRPGGRSARPREYPASGLASIQVLMIHIERLRRAG